MTPVGGDCPVVDYVSSRVFLSPYPAGRVWKSSKMYMCGLKNPPIGPRPLEAAAIFPSWLLRGVLVDFLGYYGRSAGLSMLTDYDGDGPAPCLLRSAIAGKILPCFSLSVCDIGF